MIGALIIGAGLVLALYGFIALSMDRGWKFSWWQWLLMVVGTAIFLYGVAFLGTSVAEGTVVAGLITFGIALVLAIIIGAIVGRTRQRA